MGVFFFFFFVIFRGETLYSGGESRRFVGGRKAKIRGENDIWGRKRLIFEEKSCLGVKMSDLGEKMIENGGRKCQIFRLEAVLCGKNVQFPGTEVVFRGENTQHGAERGYSGGRKIILW